MWFIFFDDRKSGTMDFKMTGGLDRRRLRTSVTRPGRPMTPRCSSRPTPSGSRTRMCVRCEHGHHGNNDKDDDGQVRLDFDTFELAPPSLTHFPIGECDLDRSVFYLDFTII